MCDLTHKLRVGLICFTVMYMLNGHFPFPCTLLSFLPPHGWPSPHQGEGMLPRAACELWPRLLSPCAVSSADSDGMGVGVGG